MVARRGLRVEPGAPLVPLVLQRVSAKAMPVPTFPGRTASAVARLRPRRPILALTHKLWSVNQMAIEWGVTPIWIAECKDVEDLWNRSLDAAKEAGVVESGDTVVITAGRAASNPRRPHRAPANAASNE